MYRSYTDPIGTQEHAGINDYLAKTPASTGLDDGTMLRYGSFVLLSLESCSFVSTKTLRCI